MKFLPWTIALLSLLTQVSAGARENGGEQTTQDVELTQNPGPELTSLASVDLTDLAGTGGIGRSWSDRWPEDLVIAPVPGRSPQLGWMLTLAGGYFIGPRDEASESPPSIVGGFGMIAENGSYAYGAGTNLHLLDDDLRVKAGAAYFDIDYQYYGSGKAENDLGIGLNILQEMPIHFVEGSWRVWNRLYVGLGYLGGTVDTRARIDQPEDSFFDPVISLDIGAYTVPIQLDTRDSETFPRNGWLVTGRGIIYRDSAGSDFDAETFKLAINNYRTVRERDVLALRLMFRSTHGNAPFFVRSAFGGSTDLRGYPSGRYRDDMMYAAQAEYRWQVGDRWVLTGFAGVGEVAGSFGDMGDDFLPAAGVGARFVLSTKHEVGLAFDIATGKDGTEFYFGVGEAF